MCSAKFLSIGGRVAGVAAGLVMAGWDFAKAYEKRERGNHGTAFLYAGSGALGLFVTAGFWYLWAPFIMFWLVAWLVLVVVLLEVNKPNKLMEWLQRCVWGKGPAHYGSIDENRREFGLALKG
jgi:hypothetical protein